ncbi:MAG: FAD-dependent oxidoreductase [Thaumarchaeota archaeon]|nr:FAD-dependent oxidoreductase [Nitrososphaerota archaeon]
MEKDYDIAIIGAGAAGMSAALSAAEVSKEMGHDVRIVVLERSEEADWGGNSRWTTSNFRMIDESHLYPTFEEDIMKDSEGKASREYVHRLAHEAIDTITWIRSRGVVLEARPGNWSISGFKMGPVGGGLEIITKLRTSTEKFGVSLLFNMTAYKLIQDDNGNLIGLLVRDRSGVSRRITTHATILAGGGFEGNCEMLTKYIGRDALALRTDVPATKFHMGECINMAFDIGAAPSGEFGNYHGDVVDSRSNTYRASIRAYVYGILVNNNGERFIDEGMDEISGSFEFMSRAIFKQPGHIAYVIFDQKTRSIESLGKDVKTSLPPYEARDLTELAEKIGISPAGLIRTVDEFNKTVEPGEFNPTKLDGKHTSGILPPKSNWAVEIDSPPYFCYPVEGTVQFTWGGVACDSHARVLAANGKPISGLYAAGETVGFYYHHFTPGTAVLMALTYGRIAGFEAVQSITEH